ncbi:hypothetical protein CEXT_455201 [Caerostris extrusa]|uniref:Uncharacterized protein n=1 Tax=Caerostris extrusa TaxID=172846 RepID=A0AAV4PAW0_CAEEX|nr:hypothetical protein CEXT_455201 [Caerostris extrusa]
MYRLSRGTHPILFHGSNLVRKVNSTNPFRGVTRMERKGIFSWNNVLKYGKALQQSDDSQSKNDKYIQCSATAMDTIAIAKCIVNFFTSLFESSTSCVPITLVKHHCFFTAGGIVFLHKGIGCNHLRI